MSLSPSRAMKLRRENKLGRILTDDDLKRSSNFHVIAAGGLRSSRCAAACTCSIHLLTFVCWDTSIPPSRLPGSLFPSPAGSFLLIRVLPKPFRCFRSPPLLGTLRSGGDVKNILCDHRSATTCHLTAPHVNTVKRYSYRNQNIEHESSVRNLSVPQIGALTVICHLPTNKQFCACS